MYNFAFNFSFTITRQHFSQTKIRNFMTGMLIKYITS